MFSNYYTNNGLGKDGKNFNTYVMPSLNVGLQAFQSFVTAKYGSTTTQQVVNNPNSQQANDLWYAYQMSLMQNQNSTKSDNTTLYIALAAVGLLAVMMMSNTNNRR